jgi:hypothetical protein
MTITTAPKPNFTQPISIDPNDLYTQMNPQYLLGLSATPLRTDKIKLAFSAAVNECNIHQLIQEDFLSRFNSYIIENFTPAEWYDIIMHDRRKCVLCDCLLELVLQYPEIFAQWCKFGTGSLYQPVFWQLTKA